MDEPNPNSSLEQYHLYSKEYREAIFYWWLAHRHWGAVRYKEHWSEIPADEEGFRPNYLVIAKWKRDYDWENRAAQIDTEVEQTMNKIMIDERLAMYKRHAEIGQQLQTRGLDYLESEGLDSDAGALRAVIEGVVMERTSRTMSDMFDKIASMDANQLTVEINKLLGRGDAIDAETEEILPDDSQ